MMGRRRFNVELQKTGAVPDGNITVTNIGPLRSRMNTQTKTSKKSLT